MGQIDVKTTAIHGGIAGLAAGAAVGGFLKWHTPTSAFVKAGGVAGLVVGGGVAAGQVVAHKVDGEKWKGTLAGLGVATLGAAAAGWMLGPSGGAMWGNFGKSLHAIGLGATVAAATGASLLIHNK